MAASDGGDGGRGRNSVQLASMVVEAAAAVLVAVGGEDFYSSGGGGGDDNNRNRKVQLRLANGSRSTITTRSKWNWAMLVEWSFPF